MKSGICFLGLLLFCFKIHPAPPDVFVFWNVGQGLWLTWSGLNYCSHFDMGGETNPLQRVLKECWDKKNLVFYSHWDSDHINFSSHGFRNIGQICVAEFPGGDIPRSRKARALLNFQKCDHSTRNVPVQEIKTGFSYSRNPLSEFQRKNKKRSSNDDSRIYVAGREFLLPGDSTRAQELIWAKALPSPSRVRILSLGHHGSKTSTSRILLDSLPHLKIAIASARQKRYGHPHPDVVMRLKEKGVSVLRNEHWGDIRVEIRPSR